MDFQIETTDILKLIDIKPSKLAKKKEEKPEVTLTKKSSIRFVEKWMNHLPVVSVKIIFPGGTREETQHNSGVGTLLQRVWTSGTKHFNSKQIAYVLDSLGASINAYVGRHTMGISLEFLSKQWPSIKPILTDILLSPTFPEHEVELEKDIQIQDIRSEKDTPGQICQINFAKALYGEHPYGRSGLGTEASVKQLTSKDLLSFYKDYIHKNSVVVSTVGSFDKTRWESEISDLIHQLPQNGKKPQAPLSVKPHKELSIVLEKKQPLQQSHLLIGFLGPNLRNDERFSLRLLHSCLAGQGGRLFLELRDKQSLAYSVAPLHSDYPEVGMFGVYIGCSPEKLPIAIHGIRTELEKILDKTISQKELMRAKQYWLGRIALEMQRFSSQSMMFGLDEAYGLGFDFSQKISEKIKSISAEEIRKVAQKYLVLDRATLSIVHNQEVERAFIEQAWEGKGRPRRVPNESQLNIL